MPVIQTSAYGTVEDVLTKARAILNDSEVLGGDILTDAYPGSIPLVNIAYENIQKELASCGVEVFTDYFWLLALPAISSIDPEARVIVTDSATYITYPDPTNLANANFPSPILPGDMIVPLKLWERQAGTTNFAIPMKQPNVGLLNLSQQLYLLDWQWGAYQSNEVLILRGALQSQDVKIKYEKHLPVLAAVTDPVPLRGVNNVAAYEVAKIFAAGRGARIAPALDATAQEEMFLMKSIAVRKVQRKRSRRIPYSGRSNRSGWPVL